MTVILKMSYSSLCAFFHKDDQHWPKKKGGGRRMCNICIDLAIILFKDHTCLLLYVPVTKRSKTCSLLCKQGKNYDWMPHDQNLCFQESYNKDQNTPHLDTVAWSCPQSMTVGGEETPLYHP